jgi:hypothetical protein
MTTVDAVKAYYADRIIDGPFPHVIRGGSRNDLPALFASLGFTTGAEIGVAGGLYSEQLCQGNSRLRLTCVDQWTHYAGYPQRYINFIIADEQKARDRLAPYGCQIIKKASIEAARDVPDRSLDFIYIDADHRFEYVVMDLFFWTPKVRSGGIIAGHDYENVPGHHRTHVIEAVQGFTIQHQINPWFVLGRRKRRRSEVCDESRSFFWVNP